MCHNLLTPSVNMRQLRDTKKLKGWLRSGKTVELRERDTLIPRIVPERAEPSKPVEWPVSQLGGRRFSATESCRPWMTSPQTAGAIDCNVARHGATIVLCHL
jgi:hypothetical protein